MYNKEQLEQMEPIKLMEIALSMGINVTPESQKERVIYDILDKAAVDMANGMQPEKPKRKYTRKAKTEAEAPAEPAETEEKPKRKYTRKAKAETGETADAAQPVQEVTTEQPEKKKRGRKAQEETADAVVPEAGSQEEIGGEAPDTALLQQLQQHMEQRGNISDDAATGDDDVWEGDPADGTDFIIVSDLPIEDNAAMPTLDIFDRPTTVDYKSAQAPAESAKAKAQQRSSKTPARAGDLGA